MTDYGSSYADRRQRIVELRMQRVYKEAQKDLQKKAEEYLKKHEKRDIQMRAALKAGKITKEDYQNWQKGQVFIGKQWQSKVDHATEVMLHSNERALSMIRGEQFNVYSENANYQAFQIERDTRGGISFDIYDEDTVRRLITETPELLPPKVINGKRDRAWNQGIIANSITQGIIQGKSIPEIAKRMASDTGYHNMKAMTRYARTAMTAAQNAGRIDTMHRAQNMGLKVKKVWMAAHDNRVRDAHADLDGESVDVDEPFSNSIGEIDYPGDPEADGSNVWNCRCSLGYEYPDEEEVEEIKQEQEEDPEVDDEEYEDMDYEEWKEMKEEEAEEDEEDEYEEIWGELVDERSLYEYTDDISDEQRERLEKLLSANQFGYDKEVYWQYLSDGIGMDKQVNALIREIEKQGHNVKRTEHTIESDLGKINPHYRESRMYNNNCGNCTLAYDARRRGMDVEAKGRDGMYVSDWKKGWVGFEPSHLTATRKSKAQAEIEKQMLEWGEGTRASIFGVWDGRTFGHYFNAEVSGGKVRFIDGQSNKKDVSEFFSRMKPSSIQYGRTDNLEINMKVFDERLKEKGK